jgi:hypothetical protein
MLNEFTENNLCNPGFRQGISNSTALEKHKTASKLRADENKYRLRQLHTAVEIFTAIAKDCSG